MTLSLTPVLCDQFSAPGVAERFRAFLSDVRRATHRLDIDGCRASGEEVLAVELERAAQDYERALERFDSVGGDLVGALAPYAAWTSSATHAVLPLVATDAGVRLQVQTGIDSHRARVSRPWRGGFWLPECAEAEWLDPLLEEAGVHTTCVDFTDLFGAGAPEHLRPFATEAGPVLVPIDRAIIDLVWHADGYPSNGPYRDSHRRTTHDHKPWAIDGSVYDAGRAAAQVRADAADFVARAAKRVAGGGLAVCALDTELLGHWWYEGVQWLAAVVSEAAAQGLPLVHLDDALADVDAGRAAGPAPARNDLGQAPRSLDVGRPEGGRSGLGGARSRVAGGRRRGGRLRARRTRASRTAVERLGVPRERRPRGAVRARTRCRPRAGPGRGASLDRLRACGAQSRPVRHTRPAPGSLMPRVLILSWEFPPIVEGGLARHVRKLAEHLVGADVDVHVLTRGDETMPSEDDVDGIRVHRLQEPRRPRDLGEFVTWIEHMNADMLAAGVELGDRFDFDLVHGHDWLVAAACDHLARRFSCKYVTTIHATEYGRHQGWVDKHPQSYIHSVERWMANRADRVITCSHYMRGHVADIYDLDEERVSVIPNGIDPLDLQPVDDLDTLRSRFAAPDEKLVLLVGRLVYEKGFQLALEALPDVIERVGRVRFLVAGSGTHEQELREQAERLGLDRHGTFMGWIGDDVLHSLYRIADLCVIPSLYEPFGLVALEAMASGCPCIVADTGGLREVVPGGERVGLRFRGGDAEHLGVMVERMLTDAPLRDRLVAEAGEHVLRFDWGDVARQTAAVYETLLDARARA